MINLRRATRMENNENSEEAIYFDQKVEETAFGLIQETNNNFVSKKRRTDISERGKMIVPCPSHCFPEDLWATSVLIIFFTIPQTY